jgi:hypothetical protein
MRDADSSYVRGNLIGIIGSSVIWVPIVISLGLQNSGLRKENDSLQTTHKSYISQREKDQVEIIGNRGEIAMLKERVKDLVALCHTQDTSK